MSRRTAPAALLVLCLFARRTAAAPEGETLTWGGERVSLENLEELPAALPPAARSAIETWTPFALTMGYGMDLDHEGRVLLLVLDDGRDHAAKRRLIDTTVAWFDETFPMPSQAARDLLRPRATPAADAPAERRAGGEPLPEDPEDGVVPWVEPGYEKPAPPTSWVWGAEDVEPDTETVVFLVLLNDSHLAATLDFLAGAFDYLRGWSHEARAFTGFTLQRPLAGAFVEAAEGQEEWDPSAEVVNRIAQLLALRRFGQLPYWATQGLAWQAEFALRGAVYCFPYRDEFVWATEHSDWDVSLARLFEDRKRKLMTSDFMNWRRGRYEDGPAKIAWGVMDYVRREYPKELPLILWELGAVRDAGSRVPTGEGTWERDRSYEVPAGEQERILKAHTDERLFRDLARAFHEGVEEGG